MSESDHIPDGLLIDYADNPEAVPDRLAVERHLDACAACWSKLDDYRSVSTALGDEETWWLASEIASGEGQRAIRDFVARREAEDAEAERLLRPFLDSQYRFTFANIASRKRLHTGGVVRLLTAAARQECDREPRFALVLAETAAAIAEALPDDHYPAAAVNELRGTAWKEYATACRYLARFDEGYHALRRAERAYRRLIDPGIHTAAVDLARATLLYEQQCYDEALRCARSAGEQFAERRATERYFRREGMGSDHPAHQR